MRRNHNPRREPTDYRQTPALFIPPPHRPGRAWTPHEAASEALVEAPDLARREAVSRPIVAAVRAAVADEGTAPAIDETPTLDDVLPLLAGALSNASEIRAVRQQRRAPSIKVYLYDLDEADARRLASALDVPAAPMGDRPDRWRLWVKRGKSLHVLAAVIDYLDDATRARVAAALLDLDALLARV